MKKFFLFLVLLPILANGQESIQRLNQRLKNDVAIEKAIVVLHQPSYIAGDSVSCSVAYSSSKATKPRKIVTLELWNSKNEIFLQQNLLLKTGLGKGGFLIPADAEPGIYSMVIRTFENEILYQGDFIIHGSALVEGLKIYPESGYFINGLTNTGVLKYNPEMKTSFFRIKKSDGTILFSQTLDSTGYLKFQFEPKATEKYSAEVMKGTSNYALDFPVARESGVSIQVNRTNESVTCTVSSKGLKTNELQLLVCNQQGIAFSAPVKIDEKGFNIAFPNYLTGDFQTVVVDNDWNVLTKQWMNFATSNPSPAIQLKKNQYSTREVAEVQVQLPPNVKHAALRVVKKDLFSKQVDSQDRNLFLLTREYDLLSWNKLQNNKPVKAKSDQYLTINGTMLNAETNQPLPDSTLIMFFFQNQVIGYETTILKNGRFTLPIMYDFYETEKVFCTARTTKGRDEWNIKIELETDSMKLAPAVGITKATGPANAYSIYKNNKKVIDGSYRYFESNTAGKVERPNSKFEEELGGVDTSIKLADYVAFASMSELTREILPAVEHRKIHNKDVVRIYTTHKRPTNFAGPLYIIDGVMTKDPSNFVNLKPEEVSTIKVVKNYLKLRNMGAIADNGVILIETKSGNPIKNFDNSFSLDGVIFDKRVKFFDKSTEPSDRTPDLRPCLLWVPAVETSSYSFSTSDDIGEYLIQLFTTDESGVQTVSTSSIFVAPAGLKP